MRPSSNLQVATACSFSFRTRFVIYYITVKACVKLITQSKRDNHKNQENLNDTTVTRRLSAGVVNKVLCNTHVRLRVKTNRTPKSYFLLKRRCLGYARSLP